MISTGNKINPYLHASEKLFNEFFSLEEPPEVEDLPHGEEQQTAHGEDTEVKDSAVCRLYRYRKKREKIKPLMSALQQLKGVSSRYKTKLLNN